MLFDSSKHMAVMAYRDKKTLKMFFSKTSGQNS